MKRYMTRYWVHVREGQKDVPYDFLQGNLREISLWYRESRGWSTERDKQLGYPSEEFFLPEDITVTLSPGNSTRHDEYTPPNDAVISINRYCLFVPRYIKNLVRASGEITGRISDITKIEEHFTRWGGTPELIRYMKRVDKHKEWEERNNIKNQY
ncbi:MAG: hypothetical protein WCV90_03315 [Candidatus Woesearchaeota archaeon]